MKLERTQGEKDQEKNWNEISYMLPIVFVYL